MSFLALNETNKVVVVCAYLRVVPHDVVKASQQAQTGTNLHVHGPVHIIEEVEGFVDKFTALFEKTLKRDIRL